MYVIELLTTPLFISLFIVIVVAGLIIKFIGRKEGRLSTTNE
jgi:hypothetical protein